MTLAGFHTLNHSMFHLAKGYAERGMSAYSTLQQAEIADEINGYTATKHQREVWPTQLPLDILGSAGNDCSEDVGFDPDLSLCHGVYENGSLPALRLANNISKGYPISVKQATTRQMLICK